MKLISSPCGLLAVLILTLMVAGCNDGPPEKSIKPLSETGTSAIRGSLDGIAGNNVFGWAMNGKRPEEAVSVDIYEGDTLLGTVQAKRPRKDLRDKKIGTGNYGFYFSVPRVRRDGKDHTIRAKVHGSDVELRNSPRTVVFPVVKTP